MMTLEFSRRLARLGIIPPVLETIRRWHQLRDISVWPFWLDDVLIGGFLLYAVWVMERDSIKGRRFLSAAWGFACGMAYLSFFDQIAALGKPDPAPISAGWVAAVKGLFLSLSMLGLVGSLHGKDGRVD
jgi:hypothetical protein